MSDSDIDFDDLLRPSDEDSEKVEIPKISTGPSLEASKPTVSSVPGQNKPSRSGVGIQSLLSDSSTPKTANVPTTTTQTKKIERKTAEENDDDLEAKLFGFPKRSKPMSAPVQKPPSPVIAGSSSPNPVTRETSFGALFSQNPQSHTISKNPSISAASSLPKNPDMDDMPLLAASARRREGRIERSDDAEVSKEISNKPSTADSNKLFQPRPGIGGSPVTSNSPFPWEKKELDSTKSSSLTNNGGRAKGGLERNQRGTSEGSIDDLFDIMGLGDDEPKPKSRQNTAKAQTPPSSEGKKMDLIASPSRLEIVQSSHQSSSKMGKTLSFLASNQTSKNDEDDSIPSFLFDSQRPRRRGPPSINSGASILGVETKPFLSTVDHNPSQGSLGTALDLPFLAPTPKFLSDKNPGEKDVKVKSPAHVSRNKTTEDTTQRSAVKFDKDEVVTAGGSKHIGAPNRRSRSKSSTREHSRKLTTSHHSQQSRETSRSSVSRTAPSTDATKKPEMSEEIGSNDSSSLSVPVLSDTDEESDSASAMKSDETSEGNETSVSDDKKALKSGSYGDDRSRSKERSIHSRKAPSSTSSKRKDQESDATSAALLAQLESLQKQLQEINEKKQNDEHELIESLRSKLLEAENRLAKSEEELQKSKLEIVDLQTRHAKEITEAENRHLTEREEALLQREREAQELRHQYQMNLTTQESKKEEEIASRVKSETEKLKAEYERLIADLKQSHFVELSQAISNASAVRQLEELTSKVESSSKFIDTWQQRIERDHTFSVKEREGAYQERERHLKTVLIFDIAFQQLLKPSVQQMQQHLELQIRDLEQEREKMALLVDATGKNMNDAKRQLEQERLCSLSEHQKMEAKARELILEKEEVLSQLHSERVEFVKQREEWVVERKRMLQQLAEDRRSLAVEKAVVEAQKNNVANAEFEMSQTRSLEADQINSERVAYERESKTLQTRILEFHKEAAVLRIERNQLLAEKAQLAAEQAIFDAHRGRLEDQINEATKMHEDAERQKAQILFDQAKRIQKNIDEQRISLEQERGAVQHEVQRSVAERIQLAKDRQKAINSRHPADGKMNEKDGPWRPKTIAWQPRLRDNGSGEHDEGKGSDASFDISDEPSSRDHHLKPLSKVTEQAMQLHQRRDISRTLSSHIASLQLQF
ncbi:hypothetical protein BJ742DRAFT_766595 [Cladochytrium replicatum]|nr:hypothetical protein BJ742DRAFT_766595 [Cladochytrium replicatum]